jgi:hypothetical protein
MLELPRKYPATIAMMYAMEFAPFPVLLHNITKSLEIQEKSKWEMLNKGKHRGRTDASDPENPGSLRSIGCVASDPVIVF